MNGRYPRTGLLSFSYHSPPFPETILTGAQKFVKAELGHFPFQDSSLIKQKLYICLISCFQVLQNPKYDWSENNIKPITDYPAYYICNDICNIRRPETVDEWLQYFNPQTHQKGIVIMIFNITCLRKSPFPAETSINGTKFMGV